MTATKEAATIAIEMIVTRESGRGKESVIVRARGVGAVETLVPDALIPIASKAIPPSSARRIATILEITPRVDTQMTLEKTSEGPPRVRRKRRPRNGRVAGRLQIAAPKNEMDRSR
mmetsp:Transcript_12975/g.26494  ORF Transcript_12975/g.26494 Transcript_12975/m.26494 type:complete len:116 (+) Transcript_12975:1932-2279(+)